MEIINLAFKISLFILQTDFLHATKSYNMEPMALLPLRRKECCRFLSPLKSIALAGFTFSVKSTNNKTSHYTHIYIKNLS
jgi:hypothetical protein